MSALVPDDAPKPRLAHVRKWSDFNGYGFNLHAEKGKAGQYIGKIDPGSPAEFAGLKEGDRIVEVNGTNISNENHQQVVQRVKAVPDETKLLVIDAEAEEYYKAQKIVVRGDMPNVAVFTAPERNPASQISDAVENNISDNSVNEEREEDRQPPATPSPPPEENIAAAVTAVTAAASPQFEDHPYKARLCVLKIWPDFQGYGFNLHAEKNKPGQYIGKVDPGSPAEAAGLEESDRIVEVNGQNVTGENHQFVVSVIKSVPNTTRMLVLSPEADEYFKAREITITGDSSLVQRNECPDSKPTGINAVSSDLDDSHPYRARLVQLNTWTDYNGYGFNMHSIKGKEGEFIGKVEPGSPAFVAGLKEGDRVIEVGGSNIESSSHHEVVQKIKESSGRARLLVVDADADTYFTGKGVRVVGTMAAVTQLSCPEQKPEANGTSEQPTAQDSFYTDSYNQTPTDDYEGRASVAATTAATSTATTRDEVSMEADKIADSIMASVMEAERSLDAKEEDEPYSPTNDEPDYAQNDLGDYENVNPPSPTYDIQNNNDEKDAVIEASVPEATYEAEPEPEPSPPYEPEPDRAPTPEPEVIAQAPKETVVSAPAPTPAPAPAPAPAEPRMPVVVGGIEFAGSVEEAKKRMSGKKKGGRVNSSSLSAKEKFDLFQRL